MPSIESLIQVLASGLLMGAAYALVAVGFTIAFGVMNIVNFAHGHVAMAAMFVSYVLNLHLGLDPYLAAVVLFPTFFLVGILLSGAGSDGVVGMIAIKAAGGVAIVQDPREAEVPSMPSQALREDDVDATMPVAGIAAAIPALALGRSFTG